MNKPIEIIIQHRAKTILTALNKLIKKAENKTDVMEIIAGKMKDAVEQNFEEQGRPKWKHLSLVTIINRWKKSGKQAKTASELFNVEILKDTGSLKSSITKKVTENEAIVGTNKPYAAIHQFGGKAGRNKKVKIPKRSFLKLTPDDKQSILEAVKNYFKEDFTEG